MLHASPYSSIATSASSSSKTAPFVATKSSVTLADKLDLKNLPLATTPGGRAFAMKALHPADKEIKVARVPGSVLPTVAVACDQVKTISFPAGATQAFIIQSPNPLIQASIIFMSGAQGYLDHYVITNSALGGVGFHQQPPSFSDLINNYNSQMEGVQSYRITSQCMTADVIAASLVDQGTIVSAQFQMKPKSVSPGDLNMNQSMTAIVKAVVESDAWYYGVPPPTETLLTSTSAYTAKTKDGFYQPLKLDRFKWVANYDRHVPFTAPNKTQYQNISMKARDENITTDCTFPYYLVGCTNNNYSLPKPSSHTYGLTWIQGIPADKDVAIRIRVRQVVELMPLPGSRYAPLSEAPLPPDDTSLRMVLEISARMQDAYPASYNDLDKLKRIINKIGSGLVKYVAPGLDVAGLVFPAASAISKVASGAGNLMVKLTGGESTPYASYADQAAKLNRPDSFVPVKVISNDRIVGKDSKGQLWYCIWNPRGDQAFRKVPAGVTI